jgi:hypothetical protein
LFFQVDNISLSIHWIDSIFRLLHYICITSTHFNWLHFFENEQCKDKSLSIIHIRRTDLAVSMPSEDHLCPTDLDEVSSGSKEERAIGDVLYVIHNDLVSLDCIPAASSNERKRFTSPEYHCLFCSCKHVIHFHHHQHHHRTLLRHF